MLNVMGLSVYCQLSVNVNGVVDVVSYNNQQEC